MDYFYERPLINGTARCNPTIINNYVTSTNIGNLWLAFPCLGVCITEKKTKLTKKFTNKENNKYSIHIDIPHTIKASFIYTVLKQTY